MKIPATSPYFFEDDKKYITSKFETILNGESFLSMHKYGEKFEKSFSKYIGTKHAVACNSGTSALELIFRSLGVEDKEVINLHSINKQSYKDLGKKIIKNFLNNLKI